MDNNEQSTSMQNQSELAVIANFDLLNAVCYSKELFKARAIIARQIINRYHPADSDIPLEQQLKWYNDKIKQVFGLS